MRGLLALTMFAVVAGCGGGDDVPVPPKPAPETAAFTMAEFKWDKRPLVLYLPDGDERSAEQRRRVEAAADGMAERDMVLIEVSDVTGSVEKRTLDAEEVRVLRLEHDVPLGTFAVVLVGKDGGVKRRETEPVEMSAIFEQIDGMPMRQREMRD